MKALQQVHQGIGALWRQRTDSLQEYEVVRDGNVFGAGLSQSVVFSSEYDKTQRMLGELCARYRNVPFESVFSGEDIVNDWGSCFCITKTLPVTVPSLEGEEFRSSLMGDLSLIRGIGPAVQERLNARGFYSVTDLLEHPVFRSGARQVHASIRRGNTAEILDLVGRRHSRSHPLALRAAGLHDPEDFVFFDIETLGLFSRPIILFGIGLIRNGNLEIRQFLLRDIGEEPAALAAAADHLFGEGRAIFTFNGKSFDLPYFTDRLAYYGMEIPENPPHFDILHFSRMRWKHRYPSLRLTALEREILGIHRNDDIPGQMVPEFYGTYQQTGNCGPLVPVTEHNRQDVASLALLFFHLYGEVS